MGELLGQAKGAINVQGELRRETMIRQSSPGSKKLHWQIHGIISPLWLSLLLPFGGPKVVGHQGIIASLILSIRNSQIFRYSVARKGVENTCADGQS
jgi:hypothetical protein